MSLDSRFFIAPSLEMYFVDKDSGAPLSNGVVTFYQDESRTVLKPVYQLSGSPPYSTASYVELPNPITLSSVGTFQDDNGNNILPYYFPYDGTPDNSEGNVELYYITCYSEDGDHLQFTREAWPNLSPSSESEQNNLLNYVPNPQFLLHNDNFITETVSSRDISYIAQGGWTFEKPTSSTSVETLTFSRNNSPSTNPNVDSNPRYDVDINCTVAGSDAYKDLRLKFRDVNKFASSSNVYTISFQGLSTSGSTLTVDLRLIKNYGTGGSATTDTSINTITINPFQDIYTLSFIFGDNAGETLGTLDDDFLQLAIRLPNTTYGVKLSDFILTPGQIDIQSFPATTNASFIENSTGGWLPTPNPNGSDLYLPIVLTPQGMKFDDTQIGKIFTSLQSEPEIGELLTDGAMYVTSEYSDDGIPYSRLQAKLYNSSFNIPMFGCGNDFFDTYLNNASSNSTRICTNKTGSCTASADGTEPTNFTFKTVHTGSSYDYSGNIVQNGSGDRVVLGICNTIGSATPPTAGNSGFTVTSLRDNANIKSAFKVIPTAASSITAGHYFTFSNTTTTYYMWFKIDGVGVDPAPGGTGILVDLFSTDTIVDVAYQIAEAMSGFQMTNVDCQAASTFNAGAYFTINTSTPTAYYVWYTKDGAGTAPAIAGTGIKVAVLAADNDDAVALKTLKALNGYSFAAPDYNGYTLRSWNNGAGIDPDTLFRWGKNNKISGDHIGTYQLDDVLSHLHDNTATSSVSLPFLTGTGPGSTFVFVDDTDNTPGSQSFTPTVTMTNALYGNGESRGVNTYVNFVIKY